MIVSVITPYYEGKKYLQQYIQMMEANLASLAPGDSLEIILVNDSPWEEIQLSKVKDASCYHIFVNEKNAGIHQSRINGLHAARGEFVMFLDQDDVLIENAVEEFIKQVDLSEDVIVCNAILENATGSNLWYRSAYHKSLVGDFSTYLKVGTQIISPGQCFIRKSAIPHFWQKKICSKNGADDYFLWLLLLNEGKKFIFLDQPLYTHKYTAQNLSQDTKVTDDSTYEFMNFLRENEHFPDKYVDILGRMISYKDQFRNGTKKDKIKASLQNLDLLIPNIIFKLRSKTPYGFNR